MSVINVQCTEHEKPQKILGVRFYFRVYGTEKTSDFVGCTFIWGVYGIGKLRAVTYAQIDFLLVTLVCEQKEGIYAIDMAQGIIWSWLEGSSWALIIHSVN